MLCQGDPIYVARHRIKVLVDYPSVASHPPRDPRHGDSGVCPAEASPPDRAHAHDRRDGWIKAVCTLRLRIAQVCHPFCEKPVCVGKPERRGSKHLRVASPAHSLVSLRTVGRNRKVVGVHSPSGVLDEAVHVVIVCRNRTALHRLRNRSHRNRPHGINLNRTSG